MPYTLPFDYNDIRKALSNALEKYIPGVKCILEEQGVQNRPVPELPYFSFKLTSPGVKIGEDGMQYDGTTIFNRGGQRMAAVSFSAYGKDQEEAYNLMALWQSLLDSDPTQEFLRARNIAVWTIGTIADLSQLMQTGYEARAQMDVQFGFAANLSQDLGCIETVEIEGQVDTDAEIVEIEFEAP